MRDGEYARVLVAAGRNVDEIDLPVERFGDLHAVIDAVSARVALGAADADLDGEAGADRLAYCGNDLKREAHPVFEAAAVFVHTCVDRRGHELVHQPAVAAVQGDHAEATQLGKRGRVGVLLNGARHDFRCHLI